MKKIQIASLLVLCIAFNAMGGNGKPKGKQVKLKTQMDSVSYSIGMSIGTSLKKDGLDSLLNTDILVAAMKSAMKGDSLPFDQMGAQKAIQSYFAAKAQEKGKICLEKGQKFLEENKKRAGVVTLPNGLQYEIIKEGNGPKPTADDMVTTHYTGKLITGKVFDSSVDRGQPAQFGVSQVIPGWTQALQLMPVGSKWKLFIPSNLAYGERGAGEDIGPNEALIFDIELISIDKPEQAPMEMPNPMGK
jgi:FKBP-type peptidyl-prolyl cis-trans isomerase